MVSDATLTLNHVRVMYVVTSSLSAWGLLRGELTYMSERGLSPIIVCAPGKLLEQTVAEANISAAPVTMMREPSLMGDCKSLVMLYRAIRRLRPHIINYSTPKAALLGSLAAFLARAPIRIYVMRGLRAEGLSGLRKRFLLYVERIACSLAHRVYCVSDSLRSQALDLRLVEADKVRVLGSGSSHGVDSQHFCPSAELRAQASLLRTKLGLPEDAPVLGFVGRLTCDKGAIELIEAYDQLSMRFPDLRLLLVGPQEAYNGLPENYRSRILADSRIVATGWRDDVATAYAVADVIALPSYREGFPNVALEAAAMRLPVVATKVTGCVDAVVDGVTGTLVPPRDPGALADAIGQYIVAPSLRRQHGHNGRERVVRDFRPEQVWQPLYEEYRSLLANLGVSLHPE